MSLNDKIAQELNHFLKIINYKDSAQPDESLNDEDKKKSISLMRVNASGEVSAQALYRGQAFFSKTPKVKEHLIKAGDEEFVHLETEKQVVEHLKRHLNEMSPNDKKSREILEKMLEEEEMHGQEAKDHGSTELPGPVKGVMTATSKIMTTLSRYI